MTFNSRTEFAIFFYTLHHPELINKCQKDFFSDDTTKGLYEISAPFVTKYKKCPTAEEVKQMILNSDWTPQQKDKINDEVVDLLWRDSETYKTIYDPVWMKNQVEAFYRYQTLMKGIRETISYVKLNSENFTIENCREMTDKIQNMFDKKTTVDLVDTSSKPANLITYDDSAEIRYNTDAQHFTTGIKFIDDVTSGGYQQKALWMFVGAPKSGKSRWLYNLAAKAFELNYNVAYVTCEMSKIMIAQYVASVTQSICTKKWHDDTYTDKDLARMTNQFRADHNINAQIAYTDYPTSTLTAAQLEKNLLNEEKYFSNLTGKEFHYRVIFIDYLNIMSNKVNNYTENTYTKIKQIAEDVRAMAQRNGWCIVSATQSKLSYFGADTIDMSACSESSALQATCDELFGIISTPQLAQSHCQYLKILLSRPSQMINLKQKFDINEKYMRLEQSSESMIFDAGSGLLDKKDNQQRQRKQKYIKKDDNIKLTNEQLSQLLIPDLN